jgi:hypothetical protein
MIATAERHKKPTTYDSTVDTISVPMEGDSVHESMNTLTGSSRKQFCDEPGFQPYMGEYPRAAVVNAILILKSTPFWSFDCYFEAQVVFLISL